MMNKKSLFSLIMLIFLVIGLTPFSAFSTTQDISYNEEQLDNYDEINFNNANQDTFDCKVLDYIDSESLLSKKIAFRLKDYEDFNTYVFQLNNGQRVTYYLDEPVKYIDESGEIVEKDLTLVSNKNGFKTMSNDIQILLPFEISKGINLMYEGYILTLTPILKENSTVKIVDNTAEYDNVYGEGTLLRYTPTLSGIKEEIVLFKNCLSYEFKFMVKSKGLKLFSDETGFYFAESEQSEIKYTLGKIMIYDAVGHKCLGDIIAERMSEEEYIITIKANETFLCRDDIVFPVTVDPTIIVSDNAQGSNSIEDAPIFSGISDVNCGTDYYNYVGLSNNGYGTGRTVVKLNGLLSSLEYNTIQENQISSVTFFCKEASGTSSQTISLHPLTNVTWAENTVTWDTIGNNFDTSDDFGTTMNNGQWAEFDITDLVKGWKDSTYSASSGFIMKNADETKYKSFDSSEYPSTSNRPYVEMVYTPTISIVSAAGNINEGESVTFTATTYPTGGTITWSSSDTSIATVSSTGTVTGVSAKSTPVSITASATISGVTYSATYQVYITIENGIYFLKNQNSSKYLMVHNGEINDGTNTEQYAKYAVNASDHARVSQIWRIHYLSGGRYSIRPYYKTDMGLASSTFNNAVITTIGTTDTRAAIANIAEWTIERSAGVTSGCIIKNQGNNSSALHIYQASTQSYAFVMTGNYSNTADYKWVLSKVSSPPVGIMFYQKCTGTYLSNTITKYVAPNEHRNLTSLDITTCIYADTLSQTVTWSSSSSSIATVDSQGSIYGVVHGTTTITAKKYLDGAFRTNNYTLNVTELPNGIYFLENKDTERYVDIYNQTMANNTIIHQWDFHGDYSQRWLFTHLGDGYYSIKSTKSSTDYYLKVQGDSSNNNIQIVLQSGSLTDGMRWKVETSASGAYKITPLTGEANSRVLSVDSPIIFQNGTTIKQKEYTEDADYKDEWNLYQFNKNKYKLLAYNDLYYDRSAFFSDVTDIISTHLFYTTYTEYYPSISKLKLKRLLCDSNIFIIHTHGQKTGIFVGGNSFLSMNDIDGLYLNDLKFALLLSCETAKDFSQSHINNNTPGNIIEKMMCQGAETIIGFTQSTNIFDCNRYAVDFSDAAIIDESTVSEAVFNIDTSPEACLYCFDMNSFVIIAGNGNQHIH